MSTPNSEPRTDEARAAAEPGAGDGTLSREAAIARFREAQPETPLVTCDGKVLEARIGYYCLITPFPDAPDDARLRLLIHANQHRNLDYVDASLSEWQIRKLRLKLNRYEITGLDPERDVKYDGLLQAFSDIRIVGMQESPAHYWKRFPNEGEGEAYIEYSSINALIGDDTDNLVQLIEEKQSLYHVGAIEDEEDASVREVFKNAVMAYEIIREAPPCESGESRASQVYQVRYYPAKELVQRFVNTDGAGGALDRVISHGVMLEDDNSGQGFTSYTDAASFMAAHFKERADRIWQVNDPYTLRELLQNSRVWVNKQIQGVKDVWDRYDPASFTWLVLIFGLRTAHKAVFGQLGSRLDQGITHLEGLGLRACDTVKRTRWLRRIETGEIPAHRLMEPVPEDFTIQPPANKLVKDLRYTAQRTVDLLRNRKPHLNTRGAHIADPARLSDSTLIDAETAGVVAEDSRLHPDDVDRWRAYKWLYNGYDGHHGAIVFPRNDSVRTVQHANGLLVDHVPDSETAFVRFRPQFRRRGAPRMPEHVYELVDGADDTRDKVIEIAKHGDGLFRHRVLSDTAYRYRVYRLTGNSNWLVTPAGETLEPTTDVDDQAAADSVSH